MKNGQNLKLGDATIVSPQEISKRYKRQSLGMPNASPSPSIKSSGLSRHFLFITSCTVVLFLERLSFCLFCLVGSNKLVWCWKGVESSCLNSARGAFFDC